MNENGLSNEARLQNVERDVRELRAGLDAKVKDLSDTQRQVFDLLREVRESQIRSAEREQVRSCPQPGLCTQLKAQVDKLEARVDVHQQALDEAKGAGRLARWLWTAFGLAGLVAACKAILTR